MLADITYNEFKEYLGQTFLLHIGNERIELILVEVNFAYEAQREGDRDSFSVIFRGPNEPVYEQHVYLIENENLGKLELFLVPVGREDRHDHDPTKALFYEAVFT